MNFYIELLALMTILIVVAEVRSQKMDDGTSKSGNGNPYGPGPSGEGGLMDAASVDGMESVGKSVRGWVGKTMESMYNWMMGLVSEMSG